MKLNKITQGDCLEVMKKLTDNSIDILFTDPPYALGSEVIIREDGRPDYAKAVDFMNKWEMPDGKFWEEWFKEAIRVLKHGGHCLMFGMDRQLLLFKYYAHLAGFTEKQSLYWFFISNFPKAFNLAKGIEGKIRTGKGYRPDYSDAVSRDVDLTTPLAKKYSGYKYSIAPLKQTNETILVFQKPYKTGSALHDTLKMEAGDKEITCGALDIDGNRVDFQSEADRKESTEKNQHEDFGTKPMTGNNAYGDFSMVQPKNYQPTGRYPSQTFCDSGTAEVLGEPSKILHKCDFEKEEHEIYFYCPKVSKSERNAGCEGDLKQYSHDGRNKPTEGPYQRNKSVATNNHPTLKPISLSERILKLFKTPNSQRILIPFAGSGSEMIGAYKAGFENIEGCEISKEYCEIAEARIKYWTSKPEQMSITYMLLIRKENVEGR